MATKHLTGLNAVARKVEKGMHVGRVPYGYRYVLRNGKREVDVDPERAKIVQRIFKMYSSGLYSIQDISNHIESAFNEFIWKSHVNSILHNKFYIGEVEVKGYATYTHDFPTLVDEDVFNKVQSMGRQGERAYGVQNFLYKGMVYCAECHRVIYGEKQKGIVYYRCHQKAQKHASVSIPEKKITEVIQKVPFILDAPDISLSTDKEISLFCRLVLEEISITPTKVVKYKLVAGISADDLRKYLGYAQKAKEKSISIDSIRASDDPVLQACLSPKTVDELVEELQMDFMDLQEIIMDLQLDGSLTETEGGKWKTV